MERKEEIIEFLKTSYRVSKIIEWKETEKEQRFIFFPLVKSLCLT